MKEGLTSNFQIHKEGGRGLTPHGLDPYANNGEKSMTDTTNSEPNQESPILLPPHYGPQPEYRGLSDATGKRSIPGLDPRTNPEAVYYSQEGEPGSAYRSHDEILQTALALAQAESDGPPDPARLKTLVEMVRKGGFKPSNFEYNPDHDRDPQLHMPKKLTEEEVFTPGELADRRALREKVNNFIQAHPELPQGQKELYQEGAERGEDLTAVNPNQPEGSGKLRRQAATAEEQQEMEQRRKDEKARRSIANMNELIQEIMDYSDPKWGRDGEFSLFKKVQTPEGEQEVVDQENFMHWVQDRVVFFHGESPDEQMNMFQKVRLEREIKDISIQEMLDNQDKYFKDKYDNQYKDLADFVRLTLWQFTTYRTDDIEYNAIMGDDSSLNKTITKQFYYNSRSKPGFDNMSVFANVLTMAHKFDSSPHTKAQREAQIERPKKLPIDTNLGNAINTAFLTYFNLSDPEKIKSLLGEKAKYLLDPEEVRKEIKAVAKQRGFVNAQGDVDDEQARRFLESDDDGAINSSAFLFTGKEPSTDKEKKKMEQDLIQFINIFNLPTKKTDIKTIVNRLITKAIQERYELGKKGPDGTLKDDGSAAYAQLMAFFMARPLGAGWRNDLKANANDAAAKPGKLEEYRLKMAGGERAGMVGNPYSVFMMKSVLVDYLNAARSETLMENPDGSVYRDELGNSHYYSLMQIMEKMHESGELKLELPPNPTEEEIRIATEVAKEKRRIEVMDLAKKLRPTDNSQRDWAQNHMNRAFEMFHDITESNEMDWSKFTDEDMWGNLRLNRGAFEKEFKDHFLKQMRYGYSTYSQFDFSKSVRYYNRKTEKWENAPLAETLFGKQVLDIDTFWRKEYAMNKDGTFKTRKNSQGKDEKIVLKTFEHEIDPQEIQANRKVLWKQLALARLGADIYAHRDVLSTDPRYKPTYYLMMIEAIESIPDGFFGNDGDFKSVKKKGSAFTHDQIRWLRDSADITNGKILKRQIIEDFFKGNAAGFMEALKGTLKNAFKIS